MNAIAREGCILSISICGESSFRQWQKQRATLRIDSGELPRWAWGLGRGSCNTQFKRFRLCFRSLNLLLLPSFPNHARNMSKCMPPSAWDRAAGGKQRCAFRGGWGAAGRREEWDLLKKSNNSTLTSCGIHIYIYIYIYIYIQNMSASVTLIKKGDF